MKNLLKTLLVGSAFTFGLVSLALAQTKVVIGHFGDPAPYKAIVADGTLEKATGWTIEWRQFDRSPASHARLCAVYVQSIAVDSLLKLIHRAERGGLAYSVLSVPSYFWKKQ